LKPTTRDVLTTLEGRGTRKTRESLTRYGIVTSKAFGVPVTELKKMATTLGRDHQLATSLWKSGWYEARMIAPFLDEPAKVTAAQMDRWARDFDNWAVCDAACFHLFDRTPHAWDRIRTWSRDRREFVKRGAFALLASVARHDKKAADDSFLRALPLIARAANDDRNFVKKGVSWALRSIGHRNAVLHAAAVKLATSLGDSDDITERWIGRDTLRDLNRPAVRKRVSRT
jgi:3-methyladenine DNA glycosylase AlkD